MIGEVQYGGRVTDDYDKRLLITYCKVWFGENMFADSFQFYTGNNHLYANCLLFYVPAAIHREVINFYPGPATRITFGFPLNNLSSPLVNH